ncbi:MAG: outer membrane lipoprotein-sorting protein, partial [halophilic archaeon J07HB67]
MYPVTVCEVQMLPKRSPIATVAVALLIVTAGCSAVVTNGGQPDAERIADGVRERTDEIESVRGQKVTTITRDGETNRTVVQFVQRPPNESWSEVVSSDTGYRAAGDRAVRTDGQFVRYDASENNYTVLETDFASGGASQMISAEAIERTLNRSDVSFEGTDTVAGRDVYVVSLDSETEGSVSNTTLKVDQEYWYPLEYTTTSQFGDTETTVTVTHRNVTFNEPVADDRFSFDPPEGATLEETSSVGSEG